MNPTENRGWTQMLRMGRQFLLHMSHPSFYSCNKFGENKWMREVPDCDCISMIMCDRYSVTVNKVMVANDLAIGCNGWGHRREMLQSCSRKFRNCRWNPNCKWMIIEDSFKMFCIKLKPTMYSCHSIKKCNTFRLRVCHSDETQITK
jgi:hypothetical protein